MTRLAPIQVDIACWKIPQLKDSAYAAIPWEEHIEIWKKLFRFKPNDGKKAFSACYCTPKIAVKTLLDRNLILPRQNVNNMEKNKVYLGDSLEIIRTFPDNSIDCVVTSPPYYGLRDYGMDNQIGLEDTPEQYIKSLSDVFDEVRRVLKPSGTLWLNIGDSYAGSMKGAAKFPDNAMNYKQGTNRGLLGKASVVKKIGGDYKPKDLIGIPWMLAFALRSRGWFLRQDIIWHKPNPMPESVRDRCTKAHEYIFLLSKSRHYYFDSESIAEPVADATVKRMAQDIDAQKGSVWPGYGAPLKAKAPRYGGKKYTGTPDKFYRTKSGNAYQFRAKRNKRDVWTVSTKAYKESHFAVFPPELIQPCILAGCPEGGTVLDPFIGSGTTGVVARILNRNYVGIELNPEYQIMSERRIYTEGENLFSIKQ